jgi:hypothetical protein
MPFPAESREAPGLTARAAGDVPTERLAGEVAVRAPLPELILNGKIWFDCCPTTNKNGPDGSIAMRVGPTPAEVGNPLAIGVRLPSGLLTLTQVLGCAWSQMMKPEIWFVPKVVTYRKAPFGEIARPAGDETTELAAAVGEAIEVRFPLASMENVDTELLNVSAT